MLAPPATFFPADLTGVPVVVTGDADGDLNALVNVCRHRGAVVCEAPGERSTLQCPYHAWTYDLAGNLINAPRSDREPNFDPGSHALTPLPIGTWGPFIFVAATSSVPPLAETLAELPDLVARAGIDVEALQFWDRSESQLEANWKVVVENFLECYHCRVAHPGFNKVVATGADDYGLATARTFSTQYGPVRDDWSGRFDPRGPVERSQFHRLFPNVAINILPGFANLSIGPISPRGPGRTHRFLDYFFGSDVTDEWIKDMVEFDNQVGSEDVALVESVQRGMEAGTHDGGTLFLDSEELIAHFQAWVGERLS